MSSHYLVDLFDDTLNGVATPQQAPLETFVTGSYVIRVEDDTIVRNPVDLADLLTKKYAGLLGTQGLFTQITYDSLLDASNIDVAVSTGIFTGLKGHIGLYPVDSVNPTPVLRTDPHGITWTGPGAGPPQAMVLYELFTYVDSDPLDGPYQRVYRELPADVDVGVELSFDGGSTFLAVEHGSMANIPTPSRGTQLVLRFTRLTDVTSVARVFLGSWAVLY